MSRAASILGTSGQVRILKLCMDSMEDRQTYERIRNDPVCEVIDKQYFSTPKGVVWTVLEFLDHNVGTMEEN